MDGGGDNQLAARSFWRDAFNYFEGVPAHNYPPPDPAQGEANADALHVALHATPVLPLLFAAVASGQARKPRQGGPTCQSSKNE